jgi:DNA-binding winged helix-turn-helix (wHTH) protein
MADGFDGNLEFGPFELSSRERVLRREGVVLPLGDRALGILSYLAERPGKVIAKQELLDHIWSDVTVEEGSIRVHVAAIRKALDDGQFGNRYIANIKGRGYSFVGTVEFGGEVYFVDLGSLADPDLVVRAIGTSLGLVLKSNEPSLELVDLICSRKLLIILDNCEHVIQAVASIAEQLFQGAGEVHLLATSRELLRVEGEHCYRVDPTDFPPAELEQTADAVTRYPAAQLFVARGR